MSLYAQNLSNLQIKKLEHVWDSELKNVMANDFDMNFNADEYIDALGLVWNESMWPGVLPKSKINLTRSQGDGFRAGGSEWLGFILAIYISKILDVKPLMIEMGSSQGLWCASWIRAFENTRAKKQVEAYGYEAAENAEATYNFWKNNFKDFSIERTMSSITFKGKNWSFKQNRKAIGKHCNGLFFPIIDISTDNGAQATDKMTGDEDYRGKKITVELVESTTIPKILDQINSISILHVDLQGSEREIFTRRNVSKVSEKTNVVVLGTHSLKNHRVLKKKFRKKFLILCDEKPKLIGKVLQEDGTITMVNKKLINQLFN